MNFLRINYENQNTIMSSFDAIANYLFSNIIIEVNESSYRLTNIEFYCCTRDDKFQDPYTHKNRLQLESGKLYLHGSGIDITCGDGKNYCSILIRGVAKIHDGATQETAFIKYQIDGPHKVSTELFGNIHFLNENATNKIALLDIKGNNQDSLFCLPKHILKTKRVGLGATHNSTDIYYKDLPIRYLLFTPAYKMKFKGIENILTEKIQKGELTKEEAFDILGYHKLK